MAKISFYAITMLLTSILLSCFNTKDNNLLLQGTYLGTVPAADCPGIDIELAFAANSKYTLAYTYQDRQGVFIRSGSFELNGERIKLLGSGQHDSFRNYLIQDNKLVLLLLVEYNENMNISYSKQAIKTIERLDTIVE